MYSSRKPLSLFCKKQGDFRSVFGVNFVKNCQKCSFIWICFNLSSQFVILSYIIMGRFILKIAVFVQLYIEMEHNNTSTCFRSKTILLNTENIINLFATDYTLVCVGNLITTYVSFFQDFLVILKQKLLHGHSFIRHF